MARILLIEDNPADVKLTREAFRECSFRHTICTVKDGLDAERYLLNEDEFHNAPRPDLILLDLNLPKKDGREVLAMIKSNKNLKDIPVIVLSTSKNEEDILNLYKLKANCYISKPVEFEDFINIVKSIEKFWIREDAVPENANR